MKSLSRTVCSLTKGLSPSAAAKWLCMIAVLLLGWAVQAQAVRYGIDLKGAPVTEIAPAGKRVVVLFFAASDCPISNRYIPEMARLRREFADRGVQFWEVYPNPGETAAVVRQHSAQSGDSSDVLLDTEQSTVRIAHVTVTPEAAVLAREGSGLREVYHGRIDDRYLDLGSERPRAFRHDLENAIASVLDNKPVSQPGGPPVGCAIVRQP
jgi:AhpC/TSA family